MLILRLVFMLCQKICYAIYVYIYKMSIFNVLLKKHMEKKKTI